MRPNEQRMGSESASRLGSAAAGAALVLTASAAAVPAAEVEKTRAEVPASIWQVKPAGGEIVIDGRLEESAWSEALRVPLTYETRPGENVAPEVETEVFVAHDADRLYVAFRAHDPDPASIRAHLADRDTAWSDDFVGIILDTFNDERRAFQFFANPLGVQMDSFNDDVNNDEDESWDAIWDAAGSIDEGGYSVEMAIAFNQLRFPRTTGPQVWGFDAVRFRPRLDRTRIE